jgi:penicillin amidase
VSSSGAPLLAVDYQLSPSVPALLYVAGLRAVSLDAVGATIPGIPAIWAGRNRDVAWALLPAQVHVAHLYRESLRPGPEGVGFQSRERRGWVPVARREESIRVRGPAGELREEPWVVDTTRNGPLVGGLLDGGREHLSLAWPGARGGSGLAAMLALLGASSADEIVEALGTHYEPVATLVYADRHGSVGLQVAGWIPRLTLPTGHVPVSSRLGIFRWDEPVDFEQLPAQRLDPGEAAGATGWVIATDGPVDDGLRDRSIEWLWWDLAWGERIDAVLEQAFGQGPMDLRAMASVQAGLTARADPAIISALLTLAGDSSELSAEATEVALLLREWNGEMDPQSQGAAAYHVLMLHLRRDLLEAPLGPELAARYLALPQARPRAIVESALLEAARSGKSRGWSDRERVRSAVEQALHRTRVSLSYRLGPDREGWRWGRLHELGFRSFTGSELTAFEHEARFGPFGGEGGDSLPRGVIGFADYAPDRPFAARSAATYRMTVDLASPDRMLSVLAPGQSEHPADRHFSDALGAWLVGEPSLLVTSRFLVEESSDRKLTLEPTP